MGRSAGNGRWKCTRIEPKALERSHLPSSLMPSSAAHSSVSNQPFPLKRGKPGFCPALTRRKNALNASSKRARVAALQVGRHSRHVGECLAAFGEGCKLLVQRDACARLCIAINTLLQGGIIKLTLFLNQRVKPIIVGTTGQQAVLVG